MAEDKQYGSGSIVDIDRLTKLKAKVKAECLRRKYTDSVENYGSSTYDFSNNPTVGGVIKREYYDKNATPLNAINNQAIKKANITDKDNILLNDEIYKMDEYVTTWMGIAQNNDSYSGCANSCTGLCLSCTNTCTSGCSNTCRANCANDCSNHCGDGCTSYCGGCTGSCQGGCQSSCENGCKGTCKVVCGYAGCTGACQEGCKKECDGTCTKKCGRCGDNSCAGACTTSSTSNIAPPPPS